MKEQKMSELIKSTQNEFGELHLDRALSASLILWIEKAERHMAWSSEFVDLVNDTMKKLGAK